MSLSRLQRRSAALTSFVFVLFGTLAATGAGAAPLFDPATAAEMRAAPRSGGSMRDGLRGPSGAVRNRLVTLNPAELARIVPAGADHERGRLARATALGGDVALELFPGVTVNARRTGIETPEEGGYVWTGRGENGGPASVTLVINQGEVLAHVDAGGKLYRIEPVKGRLHRVIEIDQSKIPNDLHPPGKPGSERKSETTAPAAPEAPLATTTLTYINIMVAHTANARLEAGGATQMQSRIALSISLANQAFANSGVNIRFARVGGLNEVNYADTTVYGGTGSNNYTGVLCDLSGSSDCFGVGNNRTNIFAALRTKRTTVKADLVVLMRKAGNACGVAWIPSPPSKSTQDEGFSVVTSSPSYGCIESYTLSHETGHNLGLYHDRYVEPSASSSRFNFGYVDTVGRFRDIMSYPTKCNKAGVTCTVIKYFSTPLRTWAGRKVGIPQYQNGAADAARTLNATRAAVAAYR
jgi:hypothetical protein